MEFKADDSSISSVDDLAEEELQMPVKAFYNFESGSDGDTC